MHLADKKDGNPNEQPQERAQSVARCAQKPTINRKKMSTKRQDNVILGVTERRTLTRWQQLLWQRNMIFIQSTSCCGCTQPLRYFDSRGEQERANGNLLQYMLFGSFKYSPRANTGTLCQKCLLIPNIKYLE